ncbi:MAG: hypothetical protein AAFV46_04310 [Cyanobacteria bacterium J06635_11]
MSQKAPGSGDVTRIRAGWLDLLERHRAIAIIRAPSVKLGLAMAKAPLQAVLV